MKKIIYIILLTCLYNNIAAQSLKIPQETDLYYYIHPLCRIWGISDDGKIAYTVEHHEHGMLWGLIDFLIYDMVEHKFICNITVNVSGAYNFFDDGDNKEIISILKNDFFLSVSNILKSYNIKSVDIHIADDFTYNGKKYNYSLKTEFGTHYIEKYTIKINDELVAELEPIARASNVAFGGYFYNKNDNTAILIMLESGDTTGPYFRFIRLVL
jgi:hypothetical protein